MTLTIADSGQMANPAVPGATPISKEVRAVVPTPVPAAFEGDTVWGFHSHLGLAGTPTPQKRDLGQPLDFRPRRFIA